MSVYLSESALVIPFVSCSLCLLSYSGALLVFEELALGQFFV